MRTLALAALLVTLPAVAAAQPAPAPDARAMTAADCARARAANRPCVLTIEEETVEGRTPTGAGTTVLGLTLTRGPSLIRIRRDFIPEILRSAEDID